jgi:lysophospholipase L1-like esterase
MTASHRNKFFVFALLAIVLISAALLDEPGPTVYLIGDSTMADKPLIGNPERGWGQLFPQYFQAGIRFENHARNGRSTKSFIAEGLWDVVRARLRKGDYVLMQFGHNDAKQSDSSRYAPPHTAYRDNLRRFISETRAQNATPILITPVARRHYDSTGTLTSTHGDYPAVVQEVGREEHVPVIDLTARSLEYFGQLGPGGTEQLFLRADSGVYSALPGGKSDNTHFVSRGAVEVSRLVVREIRRLHLPLEQYLRPETEVAFEGVGKNVVLDNYYNNEWKSNGSRYRFHYLWQDTAASGFSMLASLITNAGATIDTLCRKPTIDNLKHANVYIIVDPDTPKETDNPNYADSSAASALFRWVNAGGFLVMLENDSSNADIEHFNIIAERFGIHFNEDSRNHVEGTNYVTATFQKFPDHPLFKDVRRIYLKELSTLRLQEPATAILSDNGDVILAFARFGRGGVFAAGDPWFYNEYMDHQRLPEGYDNPKAADNLFRWLLSMNTASR